MVEMEDLTTTNIVYKDYGKEYYFLQFSDFYRLLKYFQIQTDLSE